LAGHLADAANIGYGKAVLTIVERHVEDITLRAARITHGWWQKFLRRNPLLSLWLSDSTAGIRMDAINEEN